MREYIVDCGMAACDVWLHGCAPGFVARRGCGCCITVMKDGSHMGVELSATLGLERILLLENCIPGDFGLARCGQAAGYGEYLLDVVKV